jgi:hypothetical protein
MWVQSYLDQSWSSTDVSHCSDAVTYVPRTSPSKYLAESRRFMNAETSMWTCWISVAWRPTRQKGTPRRAETKLVLYETRWCYIGWCHEGLLLIAASLYANDHRFDVIHLYTAS